MCLVNCEVVISTFTNPRHNRLSVVPLFNYIIVYSKMNVNIRFIYLNITRFIYLNITFIIRSSILIMSFIFIILCFDKYLQYVKKVE